MMISAVYVNLNEGDELEKSFASIKDFVNEIIVVDLESTDSTKQVCKKFGAKIFSHSKVSYVELLRNYSVSIAKGDWILVLDPDERVTENLKNKLKEITQTGKVSAVNIPRKNIFFGKWIAHSNWWPDRHVRFFKKGKAKWSNKIHSYPRVDGQLLHLDAKENLAIEHYGYKTISEFIDRQNRYSNIEADYLYDTGVRFSWISFFWKPTREFLVRFIRHAGFLDGVYGFTLTFLMMIYQFQVMIKLWELEQKQ